MAKATYTSFPTARSGGSRSSPPVGRVGGTRPRPKLRLPRERDYHLGYYAAFVFDPDGNNIDAVCHDAPT